MGSAGERLASLRRLRIEEVQQAWNQDGYRQQGGGRAGSLIARPSQV